jgi:hypothetical protein
VLFALSVAFLLTSPAACITLESYGFDLPPVIGGSLDEWSDVQVVRVADSSHVVWRPTSWTGPEDCSFTVRFANDGRYLYISADVRDDCVLPPDDPVDGDHFELAVFIADRTADGGVVSSHSIFAISPDGRVQLARNPHLSTPLVGALSAGGFTENGYSIEARVDLAAFRPAAWVVPETLRIAACVYDLDDVEKPWEDCVLSTNADWRWADEKAYDEYALADVAFVPPVSYGGWRELWDLFERAPVDWASSYDLADHPRPPDYSAVVYRVSGAVWAAGYARTGNGVRRVDLLRIGDLGFGSDEGTPGGRPLSVLRLPDRTFGLLTLTSSPSASTGLCAGGTEDSLVVYRLDSSGFARVFADVLASCTNGVTGGVYDVSANAEKITVHSNGLSGSKRTRYVWEDGAYIGK